MTYRSQFFIIALAIIIMSFQGCATHREIYFADGTKGYSVNCSGGEMNFSHCLEKAGEICNTRGYNILNQNGVVIPFSVAVHDLKKNPYSPSSAYISQSGSMTSRNLFIKCK